MTLRPGLAGLLAFLMLLAAEPLLAVEPDEILDDPALEQRARDLSRGIRCLVCQNESIDSSNAGLARELRILVRERLVAGDSDRELRDYLVQRYGDFVLLEPPVKPTTWLLWFGPVLVLLVGVLAVFLFYRSGRRSAVPAAPLTMEEQARVARLLEETEEESPGGRG